MTARQDYALAHPLTTTHEDIAEYRRIEPQPDGNLLVTVLAVDR